MASIDILFPFILSWEGGYSNDPDDLGGPTNKGVTIADYREYRKQCGLPEPSIEDLKRITDAEVMDLLKRRYWDKWKADQIVSQGVANALVDYMYNSGGASIKRVQRILGVTADGIVGPVTLAAVNGRDAKELFDAIQNERRQYLAYICERRPANRKFLKGWLRRVDSIEFNRLLLNKLKSEYDILNDVHINKPIEIKW